MPCIERFRDRMGEGRVWFGSDLLLWFWDHDGTVDVVSNCPFCHFPLPNTAAIVRRIVPKRKPWESSADRWRGEDGG